MHKNASPECISNMFISKKDIHNDNTRQKLHLHIKKCTNMFIEASFIKVFVISNMIIYNIEVRISVDKFKHILEKFIKHTNIPVRYTS